MTAARQPARTHAHAPACASAALIIIGARAIAIVSGHWTNSVCFDLDRVIIVSPYTALSVAIPFPAPFEFEFVERCPAQRPRALLFTIAIAAASERNALQLAQLRAQS
jgi:hypothetical protein